MCTTVNAQSQKVHRGSVAKAKSWLVFLNEEIQMRESSMANAKPPECNSISTTGVARVEITKGGLEP